MLLAREGENVVNANSEENHECDHNSDIDTCYEWYVMSVVLKMIESEHFLIERTRRGYHLRAYESDHDIVWIKKE